MVWFDWKKKSYFPVGSVAIIAIKLKYKNMQYTTRNVCRSDDVSQLGTKMLLFCPASEMIVTRSFPVGSLIKEKKVGVQYMQHLEQWLHECIQIRSSTFQVRQ